MKCLQSLAGRISSKSLGLVLAGSIVSAGCGGADTTDGVVVPDTRGEKQFDQMKEHMKNLQNNKAKGGAASKKS
jgi:hypothetical protein